MVTLLKKYDLNAYFEIDSQNNLLMWIFLEEPILAKDVRVFVMQLLKEAYISGKSYPSSNFVNSSTLGDYIELPLFLSARNDNKTVFINAKNEVIKDQWKFLNAIKKISKKQFYSLLKQEKIMAFEEVEFPSFILELTLHDYIYIKTKKLSASLMNAFKDFASFPNPQVKILLNLRKPLYNIPRVIKNYEEDEHFLKLPRGLLYKIKDYLKNNDVNYSIEDKRLYKQRTFSFHCIYFKT